MFSYFCVLNRKKNSENSFPLGVYLKLLSLNIKENAEILSISLLKCNDEYFHLVLTKLIVFEYE